MRKWYKNLRMKVDIIPWYLIIKHLKRKTSDEEEKLFAIWLKEGKNREIFSSLQKMWQEIVAEVSDYNPDTQYYWVKMKERMQQNTESSKRFSFRSHWRIFAVAASILLVLSFSTTLFLWKVKSVDKPCLAQTYSTISGKSKVILPDGTEVWLHNNTTLSYNNDFGEKERRVLLDGEAFFSVTKNADKPFIVNADKLNVQVYGTRFNVECFSGKENILVSLLEGSVALYTDEERKTFLKPDQTGIYNKRLSSLSVEKDDVAYTASWATETVRFEGESLAQVCKYLSRWYNVEIEVDPQVSDHYAYTFTVREEPLKEILRLISKTNPVSYSFDGKRRIFIYPVGGSHR